MNVIDLFCGCGGLSSGFEKAGFNIIGGIDINPDAIETFEHNFPKAKGICCDLLELTDEEIPTLFNDIQSVDIIIGGPPCQGFSSANRYQNELEDQRNKLFFEFVKFVKIVQPKAIVIENVRGIVSNNNGYAKDRIYEIFNELGYQVNHSLLDSSEFGVPQKRIRNFFVALKNSTFDFTKLKKKPRVYVRDAISEMYNLEDNLNIESHHLLEKPKTEYQCYLRNKNNRIDNHLVVYPADIVQNRISHVPQGGNWKDIPAELFENNRSNRHSSAFKRLDESDFSVTIDTGNSHSNYFHPIYNRIPTVREAARIQSFSDDFFFCGSRTSQYRQVGNAVPPLLSKAIALAIKEEIGYEQ